MLLRSRLATAIAFPILLVLPAPIQLRMPTARITITIVTASDDHPVHARGFRLDTHRVETGARARAAEAEQAVHARIASPV